MAESNQEHPPAPDRGGEGQGEDVRSPRPVAPSAPVAQPGLRGQRERPRAPRSGRARFSKGGKRGRPPRAPVAPVSARDALDGPSTVATPLAELPSCTFEVDGATWIARDAGRTVIGAQASSGASLMQVTFSTETSPDEVIRQALTAAASLEVLSLEQLGELLATGRRPEVRSENSGRSQRAKSHNDRPKRTAD